MKIRVNALSLSLLLVLSACGLPRNVVVLLPDEDGGVGHVSVSAAGQTAELTQPLAAVGTSSSAPPGGVFVADRNDVNRTFAGALAATPRPPQIFIIGFVNDAAEVAPASKANVAAAIRAALATPNADISVVGHADATGAESVNQALSLARARAVSGALVAAGVPPAIIDVTYHGSNDPRVKRPRGVPEKLNRRVEVTIR